MKLRMAVLSASVLCLAACASSGGTSSYAAAGAQSTIVDTRMSNDELYMARVEAAARRRGIDLTWVNPPRKIVAKQ